MACKGFDFRQRKIGSEPVVVFNAVDQTLGFTVGKFSVAGNVGGATNHRLVAGYHMDILGQHQIGLDIVGTQFDSKSI